MVSSALRYRAQAPLVDALLSELGISGGGLGDHTAALRQAAPQNVMVSPAPAEVPSSPAVAAASARAE
jgi:hypothetical protein